MTASKYRVPASALAMFLLALACGDEESTEGKEGAACYGNGTCDEGLRCNGDKICVAPGSGSGGVDLDECFSCGEDACPDEASACEESPGCSELLSCTLDCANDANCAASCDVSGTTQADVANMAAFQTCVVTNCANECIPEIETGPGPGPGVEPGGPGPNAGGFDVEACFDCGTGACPSEASACESSPACEEALSCIFSCSDETCANGCVDTGLSQADLTALSEFAACAGTSCATECTPDVPSGGPVVTPGGPVVTPGGPTPTGMACTTEGERSGSCATDSLLVCQGGQLLADPCLICGVVTPEAQCVDVRLVTLLEQGTAEMSDLVGVANPEMEVVADGASLRAEWYLEVNQMGVLQFEFTQGIDPSRIDIQGPGSAVQYVTLETPGGASGCQYTLSGSRLVRYHKTTGANIDWYGCWGEFETLTTSEPTTTTIMNVRTPVSTTNELKTMTVSSVLL